MFLSALVILGIAAVATAELVLLHRERRLFLAGDRSRRRFSTRRGPAVARQRYIRLRRRLSALWATARTAPFPAEPVAEVDAHVGAGVAAEPLETRPSLDSVGEGRPLPSNGEPKLKCHAARNVLHWISIADEAELQSYRSLAEAATAAPASGLSWTAPGTSSSRTAALPPTPAGEGIVYVDVSGRVTFANAAARTLLHWTTGDRALSEVLAGGTQESAALLEAVARHELIEREVTLLSGPSPARLEISALALRDRDGNLWGAALFIRRSGTARPQVTVAGG